MVSGKPDSNWGLFKSFHHTTLRRKKGTVLLSKQSTLDENFLGGSSIWILFLGIANWNENYRRKMITETNDSKIPSWALWFNHKCRIQILCPTTSVTSVKEGWKAQWQILLTLLVVVTGKPLYTAKLFHIFGYEVGLVAQWVKLLLGMPTLEYWSEFWFSTLESAAC